MSWLMIVGPHDRVKYELEIIFGRNGQHFRYSALIFVVFPCLILSDLPAVLRDGVWSSVPQHGVWVSQLLQ